MLHTHELSLSRTENVDSTFYPITSRKPSNTTLRIFPVKYPPKQTFGATFSLLKKCQNQVGQGIPPPISCDAQNTSWREILLWFTTLAFSVVARYIVLEYMQHLFYTSFQRILHLWLRLVLQVLGWLADKVRRGGLHWNSDISSCSARRAFLDIDNDYRDSGGSSSLWLLI